MDVVAARFIFSVTREDSYEKAADDAAKSAIMTAAFTDTRTQIDAAPFVANSSQADVDGALANYTDVIKDMLENDAFYAPYKGSLDLGELAKLAIVGQYKVGFTNLTDTGLVVAGFGDKDYFPRLVAYRCYGLVLGKLLREGQPDMSQTISQTNDAAFVSFAQDEMIRTFIFGTGPRAVIEIGRHFKRSIDAFYNILLKAGLAQDTAGDVAKKTELEEIKAQASRRFQEEFIAYSFQSHSRPMRRVLGALPIDELATLAETLVLLESLKERVTRSSSSVSGPIDVAVISKNDGFIWIKRKHYFEPKLNPRYFAKRKGTGAP